MINFIKKYYKIKKDYWYPQYLENLLKDDNKLITIKDETTSVSMIHILISLYLSYQKNNEKILFVTDEPEQIYSLIKLFLRNFDRTSYDFTENSFSFYTGCIIEIIDIAIVTNSNIKADLVFVDVRKFETKSSEYVIYNNIASVNKTFKLICSVYDCQDSLFLAELVEEKDIPIIEF